MAVYRVGGNSVVRVDASAGGALTAITTYVKEIEAVGREYQQLADTHFDDAAERVIPGLEVGQEIALRGAFDDAATTGPDAIFSTMVGTISTFEWNPAGTASTRRKITMEVLWTSYKVSAAVGGTVAYEARGRQDGAATIGTNA